MRVLVSRLAAWLWLAAIVIPVHASELAPSLAVDGTTFVLATGNGLYLKGADLVGAELSLDEATTMRIEAVRPDPIDSAAEVLLHRISVRVGDGVWENPCVAAADGTREAIAIPGQWDAEGRYHADRSHFALSCTSGAQAKCVRFGYRPWKQAADGTPLAPLYESCVRMVRADYCGDGEPATRDGTLIDIYDHHGIQVSGGGDELRFEAGWSPQGAVCVAHTRIADELDLELLVKRCPRLRESIGTPCDEMQAKSLGALIFNRSR